MTSEEIKQELREIVFRVSGVSADELTDDVSFVKGLGFDSLTLLELGMEVDFAFKLNLQEHEIRMDSLQEATDLVLTILTQQQEASRSCNDALLSQDSV